MNLFNLPEGVLVGFDNPILDITTSIEENVLLEKYDLADNSAIIAEEKHLPLFEELCNMENVTYAAGGACHNSLRIFQIMVTRPFRAYFVGAVGKDKFGEIIARKAEDDGVRTIYQQRDEAQTGTCAIILRGRNRSLVANLGAAAFFSEDWLYDDANLCILKRAHFIYATGFFLAVSAETVLNVAKIASENNRTFVLNFSAVFVLQKHKPQLDEILPYTDLVIGNKHEALAFAETHDWDTTDIFEIGKRLQALPKENLRPRIVMITDVVCTVLCFQDNEKILEYPVPKIDKRVIDGTISRADAFVGGFLSQLVQHMPLDFCIRAGVFASQELLRMIDVEVNKLRKFNDSCI